MVESGGIELSRTFLWVRMIQSDQSEYIPGKVLLKDQLSCCIQWSYTVTHRQLPTTLNMTKH